MTTCSRWLRRSDRVEAHMAKKRGKGFAAVWYSTGMSGGGDPSQVVVKMRPDGSVDVLLGSVDIGQGARTIVRQIAAQELGVPIEKVNVTAVDSDTSPLDTGTFASRVTHQPGTATWDERRIIAGRGAFGWPVATVDPETGEGEPLHNMAYGATVAEIEVDTETGWVTVLKMASAYDCGKAINPMLVEGQIDGGAAGGLGSALMEELHPYYPTLDPFPTA